MSVKHGSKEADSTGKSPSRRDYLSINAINPNTGEFYEVMLSHDRLHRVCSRSIGQTKEAKFLVPEVLQKPKGIFEGLRKEEDQRYTKTEGWLCYCGIPNCAYARNGNKIEPRQNEVLLVFVDIEKVAYLWYWDVCDDKDPNIPIDWEMRFKVRRL